MTKQKEQALVVSQEQLADGIFSMWIQTKAAAATKGTECRRPTAKYPAAV